MLYEHSPPAKPCDKGTECHCLPGIPGDCCLPEDDFRLTFPADPQSVRTALRAVLARFLRSISEDDAGTLEIVLAEVLNNVVEHSYEDRHVGTIRLRIARDGDCLAIEEVDDGQPMPGGVLPKGAAPVLALAGEPDDLPEGGFGWFLIRDLTRDLSYVRDAGVNRLRFTIPLHWR